MPMVMRLPTAVMVGSHSGPHCYCLISLRIVQNKGIRASEFSADTLADSGPISGPTVARRTRSEALLSWPQAAMMSSPRGVRTGEA